MLTGLLVVGALLVVGCSSGASDGDGDDTSGDEASELRRKRDAGHPSTSDAATLTDAGVSPDVAPPPPPPSLYGFTDGAQVIGKGLGAATSNEGPSYQCRRRTHANLPCGGWVQLSTAEGQTLVTFHASSHYDWWEDVSGHGYLEGMNQVPPPGYSRFWYPNGTLALDAAGHAERHDVRRDPTINRVTDTTDYVIQAEDGAISVSRHHAGDQSSCNSSEDTCTFRVLAH